MAKRIENDQYKILLGESSKEEKDMKQIISLGLGLQSTALYLMSSMGMLPRADYAIFSDTGKEATGTYAYLDFLQNWQQQHEGIPIIVCQDKNLYQDLLDKQTQRRFVSIPAYTKNADGTVGMLRRQCTADYKIKVVDAYIRDHIYQIPKGTKRPKTAIWHGITLDEIERMSFPHEAWKINTYPFLGYQSSADQDTQSIDWAIPMSRMHLEPWYAQYGLPIPPKSSCVFCPYQSDRSWLARKERAPQDFQAAVLVDQAIRNSTAKGIRNPVYLHRSCKPLAEAILDEGQVEEWGECSGNCHV